MNKVIVSVFTLFLLFYSQADAFSNEDRFISYRLFHPYGAVGWARNKESDFLFRPNRRFIAILPKDIHISFAQNIDMKILSKTFSKNRSQVSILFSAVYNDFCHRCPPILIGAIYRFNNSSPITKLNIFKIDGSSLNPTFLKTIKLYNDKVLDIVSTSFTSQGFTQKNTYFILFDSKSAKMSLLYSNDLQPRECKISKILSPSSIENVLRKELKSMKNFALKSYDNVLSDAGRKVIRSINSFCHVFYKENKNKLPDIYISTISIDRKYNKITKISKKVTHYRFDKESRTFKVYASTP